MFLVTAAFPGSYTVFIASTCACVEHHIDHCTELAHLFFPGVENIRLINKLDVKWHGRIPDHVQDAQKPSRSAPWDSMGDALEKHMQAILEKQPGVQVLMYISANVTTQQCRVMQCAYPEELLQQWQHWVHVWLPQLVGASESSAVSAVR